MAPLVGATVMSERMWKRLSPDVQAALREAARATESRLLDEIPKQDREAVEQMADRGMTVVGVSDAQEGSWRGAAEEFASVQRRQMDADSRSLLDQVMKVRDAYRASHGGQ